MSDYRVVQCNGVKKVIGKPARICNLTYRWTAKAVRYGFGAKGTSVCPKCGTDPDFKSPINRYLAGELTQEEFFQLVENSVTNK